MGLIIKDLPVTGGLIDSKGSLIDKEIRVLFRTGIEHSSIKTDIANEICNIIPVSPKTL
ncbi:MAG: hypothetical protein ACTSRG_17495 [Candidatus Helarchaeota archaeon]